MAAYLEVWTPADQRFVTLAAGPAGRDTAVAWTPEVVEAALGPGAARCSQVSWHLLIATTSAAEAALG
jgi:hypothetical protein